VRATGFTMRRIRWNLTGQVSQRGPGCVTLRRA
jgi:hypothetical protein